MKLLKESISKGIIEADTKILKISLQKALNLIKNIAIEDITSDEIYSILIKCKRHIDKYIQNWQDINLGEE